MNSSEVGQAAGEEESDETRAADSRELLREAFPLAEQALDLAPEERAAFLADVARERPALLSLLSRLLDEDEQDPVEPALPSRSWIGRTIGPYRLMRRLGGGFASEVYEAQQETPRRQVALKLLLCPVQDEGARRRFEFEIEVQGRLRHPSIATLFEGDTIEGPDGESIWYYAMELVRDARTLVEYCEENDSPLNVRLELFLEACDAVAYCHEKGIIHRDLKPGNLLVDGAGRLSVIDYGIARSLESLAWKRAVHTGTGAFLGTLGYMAPEQYSHEPGQIDERTDIYALGLVLHELLTGEPAHPIAGGSPAPAFAARRTAPRPSERRPGLPRALDSIVRKCIRTNPRRRYASVSALGADLRGLLDRQRPERGAASPRARRVGRSLAAIALATAGLAAWSAWRAAGTPAGARDATATVEAPDRSLRASQPEAPAPPSTAPSRTSPASQAALSSADPFLARLGTGLRFEPEKTRARLRFGGDGYQRAISTGLGFLAEYQSPDGHWDCDGFASLGTLPLSSEEAGPGRAPHDVGITGLALLAFMGDGNTASRGEFERVLRSGLSWLSEQQQESGLIGDALGKAYVYDHAIATFALCEAVALEADASPDLRAVAEHAVEFALSARNPYGVWRYDVPPVGENDTSVTGWMLQALEAAARAGIACDPSLVEDALGWLDKVSDPASGRVGYSSRGEASSRVIGVNDHFPGELAEAMTAVGLSSRFLLGQRPERDAIMAKHADLLLRRLPAWEPEASAGDMVYLYHGTLAMRLFGGRPWRAWNEALRQTLLPTQRDDPGLAGSWDADGPWGFAGGRLYATALAILSLESSYRYELRSASAARPDAKQPDLELGSAGQPAPVLRPPRLDYEARIGSRKLEVREAAGGESSADALARALAWLAAVQDSDGSWDPGLAPGDDASGPVAHAELGVEATSSRVALTALALLAFLGDGNDVEVGPFKLVVEDGLHWLRTQQDPDSGRIGDSQLHEHGVATLAMAEALYSSRSTARMDGTQRAVDYALSARNASGVWGASAPNGIGCDPIVTAWMALALHAARDSNLDVDDAIFGKVLGAIDRMTDHESGLFRGGLEGALLADTGLASTPVASPQLLTATAATMFLRLHLGQRPDAQPLLAKQAALLAAHSPESGWLDSAGCPEYLMFGAFALRWFGADPWTTWRRAQQSLLLSSQRAAGELEGSWDPSAARGAAQRTYWTATLALTLESYQRWVPPR